MKLGGTLFTVSETKNRNLNLRGGHKNVLEDECNLMVQKFEMKHDYFVSMKCYFSKSNS